MDSSLLDIYIYKSGEEDIIYYIGVYGGCFWEEIVLVGVVRGRFVVLKG